VTSPDNDFALHPTSPSTLPAPSYIELDLFKNCFLNRCLFPYTYDSVLVWFYSVVYDFRFLLLIFTVYCCLCISLCVYCNACACVFACSALTLLVGWREGHPVCKN